VIRFCFLGAGYSISRSSGDRRSVMNVKLHIVNAGFLPMEAADGIIDSPGEHLVVVRALDAANNAGLAKAVVR